MTTILKVIGSGLGLWAALLLWPGFLLFLISVLLAITLHPAVLWMERMRIGRSVSVIVIAISALGLLALLVVFLLPSLTVQTAHLVRDIPDFRDQILSRIPERYPAIQNVIRGVFEPSATMLDRWLGWGQNAVSALGVAVVVLVLTLYLLLGGRSLHAWLLAFVPRTYREKLAITMREVSDVVHAYMRGQLLVSLLFAIFTAAVLTILRVPAAAPLAVIAGLCDFIPVLGILLATLPAALLALTVSPNTALAVVVVYFAYHQFETFFLLPRVYGNKLKMSTLSTLLALLVGGSLQGIIGAVLVLPLVAAYPIVERHWLGGYLRSRVLTDHKALAKAAETGSEVAIDAVLHGQRHASEGFASRGAKNR